MERFAYIVCLIFFVMGTSAQEDDHYLNLAKQELNNQNCTAAQSFYNVYKQLSHDSIPELEQQIYDCLHPKATENPPQKIEPSHKFANKTKEDKDKGENKFLNYLKDRNNPYCKAKRNRYVAWTIAGAGYPWNVTMGAELRGGGILGIGGYADIGIDIMSVPCIVNYQWVTTSEDNAGSINYSSYEILVRKVSFRYIGGVRLYYKGLFLSVGYGTIAKVISKSNSVSLEFEKHPNNDEIQKLFRNGHGLHFNVGYNLCTSEWGFFLGVSGGFAYDFINKVAVPSFTLKLGMTFDWAKY